MKSIYITLLSCVTYLSTYSQDTLVPSIAVLKKKSLDLPLKIKHAEPIYIDLMRDLGARKGEAEFNIGYGIANYKKSKQHNAFIEYEWAIADRIGMEVEIPTSFDSSSLSKIDGIKLATQYTFLVNEKHQTSLAVGYMHEMEFTNTRQFQKQSSLFKGFISNPFFIAAKNFGSFSALLYTGPEFIYEFESKEIITNYALNASIHYMIPNSHHFIGIENNLLFEKEELEYIMRPQMKLGILHNFSIGVVTGIPIVSNDFTMDFMTRIIWEPNF